MGGSGGKVALQLISTGGYYGAERALVELSAYLQEQGWDSRVVALEGQGAAELVQQARHHGVRAEAFVSQGRLGLWAMLTRLRRLLATHPGAVLHSHGYKPDILLTLMRAPRRFDCLATCHNWISNSPRMRLWEALDKRALRTFPRVAAVSDEIAEQLVASGVRREVVSVIDNGIAAVAADPAAREQVRAEFMIPAVAKLILHVGRLARSKRIDLLLQALAKLPAVPGAVLLMVGEGEERARLDALTQQLGLAQRVHFCGYRRDVARLLAAADLFVLSSELEGLPISLLEAMSAHCPIVATRVGAIPRVLENGAGGWLIAPNDPAALQQALQEALGNPELARARAQRAFAKFRASYSRDSMGARYVELYEQVRR